MELYGAAVEYQAAMQGGGVVWSQASRGGGGGVWSQASRGRGGGGGGHRPAGVGGQLSACCTKSVGTVCTPTYTIVFTNTRENSNKYLITANIFSMYSTGIY